MSVFDVDRRVLVLGLARMADALGNSFLIVVLPLFIASGRIPLDAFVGRDVAGLPVTEPLLVGVALSLFGFLNSFSQPITGRLSDRTGKRRVYILVGLAVLAVASGAYVFADAYWQVLGLRALQGIGVAFTIPCTVALVNELSPTATERGGNFGVFNTFRLVGFGFGPIIAGFVYEAAGFDAAFAVAVVGAVVSFLLVFFLIEDPERTEAAAADDLAVRMRGRDRLLDPVFALGVVTVCMGVGIALFAPLEAQINERLGQGTLLFGLEFGAVTLANVVFQIPVGRGSDRYGRRPFLVAGALLLAPATVAQAYVGTPLAMTLARFVQGVGVAAVFAPSLAVAGDLAGEGRSGTTLSVLTMAFGLGIAVGPLAAGALASVGEFSTPFVAGGVLALFAVIVVYTQVPETLEDPEPLFG